MSTTCLLYHIVFRPKNNRPVIPLTSEEQLYRYIWRFITENGGVLYAIGGMADHIHILAELPPTVSLSAFIRDLKTRSSKFMAQNRKLFPYFEGWAKGYFCETHSHAQKGVIKEYIKGQKEHHKKLNFYDELRRLYEECGLEVNQYFMADE